jgi:hypothetical protein
VVLKPFQERWLKHPAVQQLANWPSVQKELVGRKEPLVLVGHVKGLYVLMMSNLLLSERRVRRFGKGSLASGKLSSNYTYTYTSIFFPPPQSNPIHHAQMLGGLWFRSLHTGAVLAAKQLWGEVAHPEFWARAWVLSSKFCERRLTPPAPAGWVV